MSKAPIRFVATTVPGFGGTAPPEDMSMESYSKLAGKLASDLGCDAVVGHSLGANIAIEMASAGEFSGPLVLLSPSFSRRDESRFPRALDRLSRVLGHLPYSLMLKIIGPAMKSSLPPTRRDTLIAELKKNDPPLPPPADPPVSRIPRPPRLTRPTFCRIGRAGVGRVRRERRHRNHQRRARRARCESPREHRHDLRRRTLHPQPAARRDRQARPRRADEPGAALTRTNASRRHAGGCYAPSASGGSCAISLKLAVASPNFASVVKSRDRLPRRRRTPVEGA